jgi:diguanylate cyclase (GGDEF)-like protein
VGLVAFLILLVVGGLVVGALARLLLPGHAARLPDVSMRDPLTGVGNRCLGERVLAGWFEQHQRFQRRFGVLFADLDNFALINDRYGHRVGDEALRVVARTLADDLRDGDHVIRWGGEQFVILVADTDAATFTAAAERFRMLVSRIRLRTGHHHLSLSILLGGTIVAPSDCPERILGRRTALPEQGLRAQSRDAQHRS